MTRFEYFSIFNGIVVALAIENVASSFHKLFEAGDRVRWHWMAPATAIVSAVGTLGQFWLWWVGRNVQLANPMFLNFLPGAVAAILLYLVCAAALPDTVPETGIDLKDFYFSSRRQFWILVAAATLLGACVNAWSMVRANFDPQFVRLNAPILLGTLAAASIAFSLVYVRASWWHTLGIIIVTSGVFFLFGPMKL